MKLSAPSHSPNNRCPKTAKAAATASGQMIVELGCWTAGIVLIVLYFAASAGLEHQREKSLELFAQVRAAKAFEQRPGRRDETIQDTSVPDDSAGMAEQNRLNGIDESTLPIAVLRLASVGLEVPVYPDISELSLSRGAGWIDGTAAPNSGGNIALAAHRDRHFRQLKDIKVGDMLELESLSGPRQFRVSRIIVVDPDDVSVLDDTQIPTVTLVTCYPFHFIGNAPQRYIVQATAVEGPQKASASRGLLTALPSGDTP